MKPMMTTTEWESLSAETQHTLQSGLNNWTHRASILSSVLRHLDFNTNNIMECSGETLSNILLKKPEDIIKGCHMKSKEA